MDNGLFYQDKGNYIFVEMNVLFTSSWFPSKAHATLGNFVQYHAKAIGRYNKVYVLYVTPLDGLQSDFQIENERIDGVDITWVYFKKKLGKYSYVKAFKKGLRNLIDERNIKFDFMQHNIMLPHGWKALYVNHKYKIPYIISENWSGYQPERNEPISYFQKHMLKRLIRKACVICPVTQHLKNAIELFGEAKEYEIIANVVDTALFKINPEEGKQFDFIHISTLDDRIKNVSGIINAFKRLLATYPSAKLLIIGDGDRKPFEEQVKSLGVQDNVIIKGEQKRDEIAIWLQRSKIYVQFSNYENLPLVIIEAMSSGLPVISSDAGGIAEHLNPTTGILIPKKDEDVLLKSMIKSIDEYESWDFNKIRDYAVEHFSEEQIGMKFDHIYNKCK